MTCKHARQVGDVGENNEIKRSSVKRLQLNWPSCRLQFAFFLYFLKGELVSNLFQYFDLTFFSIIVSVNVWKLYFLCVYIDDDNVNGNSITGSYNTNNYDNNDGKDHNNNDGYQYHYHHYKFIIVFSVIIIIDILSSFLPFCHSYY